MEKRKIIITITSLALFFLLFLLFGKLVAKKPSLPSLPLPTEVPWKSYFSQDYKYTLSYPSGWRVEVWDIKEAANLTKIPEGSIWHQAKFKGEKGSFEVLIWENKTKAPLRNWLSSFRHEDLNLKNLPEKENFEIGGVPAILYSQEEAVRGKRLDHIFFQREDKVYEFIEEKEAVPTGEGAYDKIVSSFLFLEDEVEVEPRAENLVNSAKEDLSQKLQVKKDEIRLLGVEKIDWPDTSLGCPKEGMFYAQVITPGYKITLEGRGKSYVYHSDYNRIISCQK